LFINIIVGALFYALLVLVFKAVSPDVVKSIIKKPL